MAVKEQDMPFRVQTVTGKDFVKGFEEKDHATASAEVRNKEAEKLGIEARYESVSHK